MKENSKLIFLASRSILKILSLVREPKSSFHGRKIMLFCLNTMFIISLLFRFHGTGLAPKTRKRLSSVKTKRPTVQLSKGKESETFWSTRRGISIKYNKRLGSSVPVLLGAISNNNKNKGVGISRCRLRYQPM